MSPSLATLLVGAQELLILREAGEGSVVFMDPRPGWVERLKFPPEPTASCVEVADLFPYLESCWSEVVAVWRGVRKEPFGTGLWSEPARGGEELQLEATAYRLGEEGYLVVRRVESEYWMRQRVLQAARERMLDHERMLEERSAKEVLLHCVVHDLAGPLAGIRGCLEMLARGEDAERAAHFIGLGLAQVRRQQNLIEELLQVFSASNRKGTEAEGAVDLLGCVAEVMEGIGTAYQVKRVKLRSQVLAEGGGSWWVVAERTRLERVFFNLLENALRFAPEGSVVTVHVERDATSCWVSVEDEGPGVAPEVIPRLFQQFVKGGRMGGKAGLGLFFCRISVEQWGGAIGCEPAAGGGARFRVRLSRSPGAERIQEGGR